METEKTNPKQQIVIKVGPQAWEGFGANEQKRRENLGRLLERVDELDALATEGRDSPECHSETISRKRVWVSTSPKTWEVLEAIDDRQRPARIGNMIAAAENICRRCGVSVGQALKEGFLLQARPEIFIWAVPQEIDEMFNYCSVVELWPDCSVRAFKWPDCTEWSAPKNSFEANNIVAYAVQAMLEAGIAVDRHTIVHRSPAATAWKGKR